MVASPDGLPAGFSYIHVGVTNLVRLEPVSPLPRYHAGIHDVTLPTTCPMHASLVLVHTVQTCNHSHHASVE